MPMNRKIKYNINRIQRYENGIWKNKRGRKKENIINKQPVYVQQKINLCGWQMG